MKILIDGAEIEAKEGQSVLDAALEAGIFIPHLCKHPDLEAAGGCRLCAVEIDGDGRALPSCKTTVREGISVQVHSPAAEKVRKMAMELILATHPADCTGCPKYGKCELQSMYQYMGVSPERWKTRSRPVPTDESNPLIRHMFTRCIRCGRCIRACRELRGVKILDYQKTEDGVRVGIDGGLSLKEAGCRFCGACIEVCPTGSILDAVSVTKEEMSCADTVVPCRSACPAGVDIPRYIRRVREGDLSGAAAVIREKVPFPETLGSVCVHPCESQCKRGELGGAMSICSLKRTAAANDGGEWKARVRKSPATGKKAAVIGAGPAGLTAGYYLAKKGHEVTVYEANEKAGGQLRYGIPAYRLPDQVLDKEIGQIAAEGVNILTGVRAGAPNSLFDQGFDAVLIASGTHQGVRLGIEGKDLEGVYVNTDFLKKARMGIRIPLGKQVVVLGGGNVAYDCARTARRLGAEAVHVVCLESLEQMTATKEEIEEGREEGVTLHPGCSFLRITGTGRAKGVEVQEVEHFYFDENGKAVTQLKEGPARLIPADSVIFAVGQRPEGTEHMGVQLTHGPYVFTDKDMRTSMEGVYAAGDVVTGTKSVVEAVAAGRRCAQEMDRYLGGDGDISEQLADAPAPDPYLGRQEGFADRTRVKAQRPKAEIRLSGFGPAEEAMTLEAAKCEAGRCLQCDLRLNLQKPRLWNEY